MALSPSMVCTLKYDGFRIPVAAGTTFIAGDVVVIGSKLVGIAAADYNALSSTATVSSVNCVGVYTMPKAAATTYNTGSQAIWNSTSGLVVATTSTATSYNIGYFVSASSTSSTTCDVFLWPGAST